MKMEVNELPLYTIQENGLISDPRMGEGRLIPAVVLNSNEGNELKEFLHAHVITIDQGDVVTQWGTPFSQFFKPKTWILSVKFAKPREFSFLIEFILDNNPALIDAVFQSRGLYILYGFPGDKISTRRSQDMVLIEVSNTDQDKKWNQTFREVLKARLKKQKVPSKQISEEVEKQIRKGRELLHYRRN